MRSRPCPLRGNSPARGKSVFPHTWTCPSAFSWTLPPLNEHPNEAVKHFSGTATYAMTFELPPEFENAPKSQIYLDLGRVEALAEVVVNGRNLGVLWQPPFRVNVTEAVKTGPNTLEVRVTGTWRNRLIGDAKYPKGFPPSASGATTAKKLEFKPHLTADLKVRPEEALTPFGLMGPVRLLSSERVRLALRRN